MHCYVKAVIILFIKCDPLSLIKVSGHPNHVMTFSYINCVAISIEHDLTGSSSPHLVTYSSVVIIYYAHVHHGGIENSPMKLIAQISNLNVVFIDIKGIFLLDRG